MKTVTELLPALRRQDRLLNLTRDAVCSARASRRSLFGSDRPLPNFLVLGAQRAGTTSLHQHLCEHRLIAKPLAKEVQFFTTHYDRGESWYRAHFPYLQPGQQTFESSPYYLFQPYVPRRVATLLPEAKFLVLLREPTARAFSHYLHSRHLGVENLSFEDALDAEDARLAEAERLGIESPEGESLHRSFSYKSRGLYAAQLERWLEHVAPEQLMVVKSEAYLRDPATVVSAVVTWLGLPTVEVQKRANSNVLAASAGSTLAPSTKQRLTEYFQDDAAQLSKMGFDVTWQ